MTDASERAVGTLGAGERAMAGDIAARIDRLPLTRTQYTYAGITQWFWGIMIAADGLVAGLYPFIWAPKNLITSFQFDLILGANIGVGILIGEYIGGFLSDLIGRKMDADPGGAGRGPVHLADRADQQLRLAAAVEPAVRAGHGHAAVGARGVPARARPAAAPAEAGHAHPGHRARLGRAAGRRDVVLLGAAPLPVVDLHAVGGADRAVHPARADDARVAALAGGQGPRRGRRTAS